MKTLLDSRVVFSKEKKCLETNLSNKKLIFLLQPLGYFSEAVAEWCWVFLGHTSTQIKKKCLMHTGEILATVRSTEHDPDSLVADS